MAYIERVTPDNPQTLTTQSSAQNTQPIQPKSTGTVPAVQPGMHRSQPGMQTGQPGMQTVQNQVEAQPTCSQNQAINNQGKCA